MTGVGDVSPVDFISLLYIFGLMPEKLDSTREAEIRKRFPVPVSGALGIEIEHLEPGLATLILKCVRN